MKINYQNWTMGRKIKDFIWLILIKLRIGGAVELMKSGSLKDDGWFKSFNTKEAVDKDGNPIPWCSYPFIKFIENRLSKNFDVFEFGCGNSTFWYAQRIRTIKSVEHDREWFESISKTLPDNAKVVFRELENDNEYVQEAGADGKKYSIIIIDGRERNACVKNCISSLTDDGVIVFDNADLPIYKEGVEFLNSRGFKRLDFWGMFPVASHLICTAIFYKDVNCLNI